MNDPTDHKDNRAVFILSDGTGITAEALARAVLSQFDVPFRKVRIPFIDDAEKAEAARLLIETEGARGKRPIVFSTLVKPDLSAVVRRANAVHLELIQTFADLLSAELGVVSAQAIGRSHERPESGTYRNRIDAIHFSIEHDDGQSHRDLGSADLILVGVSRCGKTPTSMYLALQYGLNVANYPLIPEDFQRGTLPSALKPYKHKLFGLSIAPERLSQIRNERMRDSRYASIDNCRWEVAQAEKLMQREGIHWLSSTTRSIEEISAAIVQECDFGRKE
jgi:hypothetical protein